MNYLQLKKALSDFLNEDIGRGDQSVATIFSQTDISEGEFLLKEDGVICGLFLAPMIYHLLGEEGAVHFEVLVSEGSFQKKGTIIARVCGPTQILLTAERLILNLWQRMGGIAQATRQAIETLDDKTIRICDTRKTAPGLRQFDKYAVKQGGGFNHRMGLDDCIMLKDNHIAFSGGITKAIEKVRKNCEHTIKIEVEIETLDQFKEAVAARADIIMLDNRTPEEVCEYLNYNQGIMTEVSGGIQLDNLAAYRGYGADYLSLGYLTHSVKALDISFNSLEGKKV